MTGILFAFIVLPIMILVITNFVFSSVNPALTSLQKEIVCPWPEIGGLWNSSGVLQHTNATYNWANAGSGNGAQPPATLTCTPVHTAKGIDYYYGASFATPAVVGFWYFLGDVVSELGHKIAAFFTLIGSFFTYPFQISGMAWWGYAQLFLTSMLVLGIILIIRGVATG